MFDMQEYSTTITFREEWLDERLRYEDCNGTPRPFSLIPAATGLIRFFVIRRQNQVSDADGSQQSVDARLVLLQRTRGPLPQHHRAQRLRPHLPRRTRPLQHPVTRCNKF